MDNIHCSICRPAVRIDKYGLLVREIFCEARLYRPDNMTYRMRIIEAGYPDKNIRFADA